MARFRLLIALLVLAATVPGTAAHAQQPAATPSKFDTLTTGLKKVDGGLWTVYTKDQQILVDLKQAQLNQDYLMLSSIARGVSQGMVLGGMTWGDDVLWSFRKVGDKIHVLRRNVKFKAKAGSPEATAVKLAYSDSVLYALPILTDTPGGHLVDMTRIFLSDDEMVGRMLGASFVFDRSTIANVKTFPKNVEIDIAAVYSRDPMNESDAVPDPRGMQVMMHYSISQLPQTGYKPRKADDRIGYFLTVTKDFSDVSDDQHFVRYINRWDLQKLDPSAKISPPKDPIVFYLEKTVPFNLRPIVRAGIEDWNKAFEKLGFDNAIEVRQQRDDDTWDPEDVQHNTFRWITAEAGFAMGPSRTNPLTGQILDADIIFDASFLRSWKSTYENFTPATIATLFGEELPVKGPRPLRLPGNRAFHECRLSEGMQQQTGFAAAVMAAQGLAEKRGELPEEYLQQALKEVVMHEVGHTLGLRHNFKASAWKSLAEMEDAAKAHEPTVASVMDYSPVNIVPAGTKQPAYYTTTLGPYDYWAIEYGYKPISGDENAELAKIASRSGESGLDFGTDEDAESNDPDPLTFRFDLGKDPVVYAQRQIAIVNALLPKFLERTVDNGEGYQRARQSFGILIGEYYRTIRFASKLIGGVHIYRDHKGDNQARTPFKPVDAAQQRSATRLILDQGLVAHKFDPALLNSLAATRWRHWGTSEIRRIDYPIHDQIGSLQAGMLSGLLSPQVLARLQDGELKVAPGEDVYTLAEHLKTSVEGIFSEVMSPPAGEYTNRNQYIGSFRRNTQRAALKRLSDMVRRSPTDTASQLKLPEDARVLIRVLLTDLQTRIDATLAKEDLKLDDYTRAHLIDAKLRIKQTLEAESEDFGKPQSSGGGGSFLLLGQPNGGSGNEIVGELQLVPEDQP
ncbi:zinc-dependent metalloprotease [Schlesneria sp. DSM 10557]|uniref:zinc-dependent metalloprotease n=2 Tax=unclassified Schlesneria TaxID=2762017 RepID=UPI0035A10FB2